MFVADLDDTLFDEIDYVRSGYRAIGRELEHYSIMPCAEAVLFLEASSTTAEGFDDLSAKIWVDHPGCRFNAQWMVDTYRYHIPDISLRPGALDLLEGLKRRGVPIGIITDGRSATQRAKIKALGLDRFVADGNIIISGETGADKTTSLPFETLANRNPGCSRFLYLGDNPAKDFRWPNAMGWDTVEIIDSEGIHIHPQNIEVPPGYRAHHTISRLPEALAIFDQDR